MVAKPTEFRIATQGEFSRDSGIGGKYGESLAWPSQQQPSTAQL
jgi:hypothetical protein